MKPLTEVLEAVKRTIPEQGSVLDPRKSFAERAKSRPTLNDFQAGLEILKETIRLGMGTESKLLDVCRYAVGLIWIRSPHLTNEGIFEVLESTIRVLGYDRAHLQRVTEGLNSLFFYKIKSKFTDLEAAYASIMLSIVRQETDGGEFYLICILSYAVNCLRLMGNSSTV